MLSNCRTSPSNCPWEHPVEAGQKRSPSQLHFFSPGAKISQWP